ncbi:hypothetical protein [Spirillospora sp. CA-294931]|uniref:hypothetical protein n=1 Tax=Spirillospora sp. CA-294931 TaxID=3240042 RepID=UPI003D902EB1
MTVVTHGCGGGAGVVVTGVAVGGVCPTGDLAHGCGGGAGVGAFVIDWAGGGEDGR